LRSTLLWKGFQLKPTILLVAESIAVSLNSREFRSNISIPSVQVLRRAKLIGTVIRPG
jgi:hypothetical protein